ncbi:MAG TPA: phosphatase PAP2 family protein [Kofleriaceae bacterium]|jgi:hypothetical protein
MRLAAALVIVSFVATAHADPRAKRTRHLVGIGAATFAFGASVVFAGDLAPARCRWCVVPDFDEDARDYLRWSHPSRAGVASNITGYALAPATALGLTLLEAHGDWGRALDDEIPIVEAVVYSEVLTQGVKLVVARARPYAAFGTPLAGDSEQNLSFYSGHTCLGFALAVSAGEVAHRRHSELEPVIWGAGLALAATTGYLRIAADQHSLTDVLVGAGVGALAGHFVPRLLDSLPPGLTIAPTENGAAIAGRW